MAKLHRLVYTRYRKPQCTDKEIENILAAVSATTPTKILLEFLFILKSVPSSTLKGTEG